jgi:hypothetical protein
MIFNSRSSFSFMKQPLLKYLKMEWVITKVRGSDILCEYLSSFNTNNPVIIPSLLKILSRHIQDLREIMSEKNEIISRFLRLVSTCAHVEDTMRILVPLVAVSSLSNAFYNHLVNAGGLETMFALLKYERVEKLPSVHCYAAWVVSHIITYAEKTSVLDSGGLDVLCSLLDTEDPTTFKCALRSLHSFLIVRPPDSERVQPTLHEMVKRMHQPAIAHAVSLLLLTCEGYRRELSDRSSCEGVTGGQCNHCGGGTSHFFRSC